MSLINDALRRAREAQQQVSPPPPSQMHFRPVEPGQRARHGLGLMVPAALAVVALLGLLLVWQWARERGATAPREARALTAPATITPQAASPLEAAAGAVPAPAVQPSPPPQPETPPPLVTGVAPPLETTGPATPTGPPVAKEQERQVANSAEVSPPLPKPAPLRLQAIVFNPRRPSALIGGKTLFIGDKLGDSRVVAIDQESATLVGAGKTNILSLPE